MSEPLIEIDVLGGLGEIAPEDWDACACPEAGREGHPVDPFTTWRFLNALEVSASVGSGTGWVPRHLVARRDGKVIAVAPLYAKGHSQGEYIFDHGWAHAYEQAGRSYYPKLQVAVPFTPVTGRRLLTRPGFEEAGRQALLKGAVRLVAAHRLSSLHITFCSEAEARAAEGQGLMHRISEQFHWVNRGYGDFGEFLAALSSRKRKNIRRERAAVQAFGGTIHELVGDMIEACHWDAFWRFYQDTGARKWGMPYLTRAFFEEAHASIRHDILLVLAERDGRYIAGALNFIGRETLYGRYWGCVEDHPFLHFELCYYRAIDYAIRNGLARVEAGAQGPHKLARGYLPVACHSSHWFAEPGMRSAVKRYLNEERRAVSEEIDVLTEYGPFRDAGEEKA